METIFKEYGSAIISVVAVIAIIGIVSVLLLHNTNFINVISQNINSDAYYPT